MTDERYLAGLTGLAIAVTQLAVYSAHTHGNDELYDKLRAILVEELPEWPAMPPSISMAMNIGANAITDEILYHEHKEHK